MRALIVFPAHAGVILADDNRELLGVGFPRTRGGDPYPEIVGEAVARFSPHTRG